MRMLEAGKRQQLSLTELYRLNWFLGAFLALLSFWPVFDLDFEVLPHAMVAVGLIAVSAVRPQLSTFFPKTVWYATPFLLVILLAIDLYLWAEIVPALVRLNILLVMYRSLSFRRKREDLQLIVLCLFLVIIAGVRTVPMAFVVQVLLFTTVAMAFLFNITLMENSRDTMDRKKIWEGFTWWHFLRKLATRCDLGFLLVAGIALSSVVVFSVILFFIIPRIDLNTSLPLLGGQGLTQTGFSEQIRFGDVTNIRNNDRVALRVEVSSSHEIPQDPYWRMLVLDDYANGNFSLSPSLLEGRREERLNQINYNSRFIGGGDPPNAENLWTFYLERGVARYLPLTGRFERIRFQESREMAFLEQAHILNTLRANAGLMVYEVENMDFNGVLKEENFGVDILDSQWSSVANFPGFRQLDYPGTTMALPLRIEDVEYLEGLVEEIGGGEALTAAEFAERAIAYLQKRHAYSMSYSLPRGNEDHVVRWMKSRSPGHCEAFAAALILICRSAAIPARAVTGFRGGTWNTFENYFMVRNSDAHAWVEIFDGRDSWLRFDPTPGGASFLEDDMATVELAGMLTDSSFSAYLDSLRFIWYRRIVSFDQDSQVELWTIFQEGLRRISFREWMTSAGGIINHWWQTPWDGSRFVKLSGSLLAAGLVVFLIVFCFRKDRMALLQIRAGSLHPIRKRAGRQLQRLRGLDPPHAEPEVFKGIVSDLERLRFGPLDREDGWRETLQRAREIARLESRRQNRTRVQHEADA